MTRNSVRHDPSLVDAIPFYSTPFYSSLVSLSVHCCPLPSSPTYLPTHLLLREYLTHTTSLAVFHSLPLSHSLSHATESLHYLITPNLIHLHIPTYQKSITLRISLTSISTSANLFASMGNSFCTSSDPMNKGSR